MCKTQKSLWYIGVIVICDDDPSDWVHVILLYRDEHDEVKYKTVSVFS